MESALYGIFTLVGFVYFTNSCENPVRTPFPWSNLYLVNVIAVLIL